MTRDSLSAILGPVKGSYSRDAGRRHGESGAMNAQSTTSRGLHWDPEAVPQCMQKHCSERATEWDEEATRACIQYRVAAARVHRRTVKAVDLECEVLDRRSGRYHVTGGDDPEGHTVDLLADWGEKCTCGSHAMAHAYCKHLMRVGLERGMWFADMKDANGILQAGMFRKAVEIELNNAARRREGQP